MLTIIAAGLAATTIAAVINKVTNRQVKIVVPQVTFVQDSTFTTPAHLLRRMEADRQAHVEDFKRRLQS